MPESSSQTIKEKKYIDTPEALAEACEALKKAPVLCVDTEFHRESTYYSQFALMQVADRHCCYLIDPQALNDLSALWDIICDPNILKVFHAAYQDVEIILKEAGRMPTPLFDTQVAAALLGYGLQIGFGNLVQRVTRKTLPKQESFSDWMKRPLTQKQLDYAADDVIYLMPVYQHLKERLEAMGRTSWLNEEQSSLTDPVTYQTPLEQIFWKVKGVTKLKPKQMAVLREVAAWREAASQKRDLPRRRIVSDDALIMIATREKLNEDELMRMRGLSQGTVKRFSNEICAAWQRGRDCPQDDWPRQSPRTHNTEGTDLRLELLETLVRLHADEKHIASSILASKSDLSELASWGKHRKGEPPELAVLHGWRRELVGNELLRMLAGELSLRIDPDTALPVIESFQQQ